MIFKMIWIRTNQAWIQPWITVRPQSVHNNQHTEVFVIPSETTIQIHILYSVQK